jgi:DNA-binding transcriptional LysR family regulator
METAFLQTFVLVAETGSMAEAARRLDMTATSVAQQLKVLEKHFCVPLFRRSGRTVQLTDAGHKVLDGTRDVLQIVDRLRELATTGTPVESMSLGTIPTALHTIVPDALVRLTRSHPDLQVHIRQDTSMNLYDAVQRGDLDAALCMHPHFSMPKTLGWRMLRKEPLVVLAPARLAGHDPHELLRREPLVRYARSQWGGKQAERYLRLAGITPKERVELTSLTAIAMMVHKGLGVSLVPDADPPLWAGLRIAKLTLPLPFEEREVGLLWLRASAKADLVKLLLQAL